MDVNGCGHQDRHGCGQFAIYGCAYVSRTQTHIYIHPHTDIEVRMYKFQGIFKFVHKKICKSIHNTCIAVSLHLLRKNVCFWNSIVAYHCPSCCRFDLPTSLTQKAWPEAVCIVRVLSQTDSIDSSRNTYLILKKVGPVDDPWAHHSFLGCSHLLSLPARSVDHSNFQDADG